MQHIKAPHSHALKPKLSPGSEEYVIEQLSSVEGKLVSLAEELSSRDLDTVHKEMEDEEFRHVVEGGMAGNVKVDLPKMGSRQMFYDEDSGSDEEFVSRDLMKKTTTALVESKTKAKPQDDDDEADAKKKRKR
ncbi:uncharacterized protein LOC135342370 [Halichondria panicea]|uniref:uncharacterized protein LOC135342370 n=1 Tax=Halichondria panicea TaxID=6063 RepID=UPI00312B8FAC